MLWRKVFHVFEQPALWLARSLARVSLSLSRNVWPAALWLNLLNFSFSFTRLSALRWSEVEIGQISTQIWRTNHKLLVLEVSNYVGNHYNPIIRQSGTLVCPYNHRRFLSKFIITCVSSVFKITNYYSIHTYENFAPAISSEERFNWQTFTEQGGTLPDKFHFSNLTLFLGKKPKDHPTHRPSFTLSQSVHVAGAKYRRSGKEREKKKKKKKKRKKLSPERRRARCVTMRGWVGGWRRERHKVARRKWGGSAWIIFHPAPWGLGGCEAYGYYFIRFSSFFSF